MNEETTPSEDTAPNAAVTEPAPPSEEPTLVASTEELHEPEEHLAEEVAVAAEQVVEEEPVDMHTFVQRQLDQQIAEEYAAALARAEAAPAA